MTPCISSAEQPFPAMSNPVGRRRHGFRRDHVDAVTLVFFFSFTTPSILFSFLEVGPDLPLRTLICALICTLC